MRAIAIILLAGLDAVLIFLARGGHWFSVWCVGGSDAIRKLITKLKR